MHGGKSAPAGPFHHLRKHGLESILQQEGILQRVKQKVRDPELLDMRSDVALLTLRIEQVTEYPYMTRAGLEELQSRIQEAAKHIEAGTEAAKTIKGLLEDIQEGLRACDSWDEITRLTEARTAVIAKERNLEIKAGHMVAASVAAHAMNRLLQCVFKYVKDERALNAVKSEYEYLLGREEGPS